MGFKECMDKRIKFQGFLLYDQLNICVMLDNQKQESNTYDLLVTKPFNISTLITTRQKTLPSKFTTS